MKNLIIILVALSFACEDPKVKAAEDAQKKAKDKLEFTQQILANTNITVMINDAGMKKGLDTVYMIADTNVTAAKEYYDKLYEIALAKMK